MKKRIYRLITTLFVALAAMSCDLPPAPGTRHAVLIGITHYQASAFDLTWPADDATSLKALLEARGWTVDAEDMLLDGDATRANIETRIRGLAAKVDSTSSVLVYYSGHGAGLPVYNNTFIIPWDGVSAPQNQVQGNWVTPESLRSWMRDIPCENQMVILDSCNSGGFVDSTGSIDTAPPNFGPGDMGTEAGKLSTALDNAGTLLAQAFSKGGDPAILTIAAAGSQEQSYDDGDHQHGAFTYYLLAAGTGGSADLDGDRLVTAVEAYSYAKAQLKANWNAEKWQIPENGMYMDFLPRISGGSGDIVLYDLR